MPRSPIHRLFLSLGSSLALLLLSFFLLTPPIQAVSPQTVETSMKPLADGLQVSLRFPPAQQLADGQLLMDGLNSQLRVAGSPAIPYYSTFIILPPEATVQATMASHPPRQTTLTKAVPPAPTGQYNPEQDLAPQLEYVADKAVYEGNGRFPSQTYHLSEPMQYGGYRLVQLTVYPLQYVPASNQLLETPQINLTLDFVGGKTITEGNYSDPNCTNFTNFSSFAPSAPLCGKSTLQTILADLALNYQQGQTWQARPSTTTSSTQLPAGQTAYKFYIDQDGIYEINYADLQNAGMDVASVNPQTFEMMYRGQPVAYQWLGDGDTQFESGEAVRFYGWAFTGPRTEEMYIIDNVLWLWADGTPTRMTHRPNEAGLGHPLATTELAEVTAEEDNSYFATWTNIWYEPYTSNEPDSWFWDYVSTSPTGTPTQTYSVELPDLVQTGQNVTWTVEVQARDHRGSFRTFDVQVNDAPQIGSFSWFGKGNRNITAVVPDSELLNGTNQVHIGVYSAVRERWYLNRITAVYQRALLAQNNQRLFEGTLGGNEEFHIAGFTQPASQALAWELSTITQPVAITMTASHGLSDGMGAYTYTIGSTHAPSARFVATANILTANDLAQPIEPYTPLDLHPSLGADWLAIAHSSLLTVTQQLATHRNNPTFGGLSTHIVPVDEIINQYGYGLPLPSAIQAFVADAYANWATPPQYLLLMGDATHNPRMLDCAEGCVAWDETEENLLLTNLLFVDRFQGLIPSDYPFSLLAGNDLLPEIAVGRIAAKTPAEAQAVIDKIILFEQNQLNPDTYDLLDNLLFIADNTDTGGDFCEENQVAINQLPNSLDVTELCYLDGISSVNAMTTAMRYEINETGASIVNYRGHGSIPAWAGEQFLTTGDTDFWQNDQYPAIVLSADCLDGYFAWPGYAGLGETFLKQANVGSAAHWSSTGLGYTFEHSKLHSEFYHAVFELGLTDIGSAINYAKLKYYPTGFDVSELYAFTLQGDPAMQVFRPNLELDLTAVPPSAPTDQLTYQLSVHNEGIYPSQLTLQDMLPVGWMASTVTPTVASDIIIDGNQTVLSLDRELARGETAVFTLTVPITPASYAGLVTNTGTISSYTGLDASVLDNQQTSIVLLGQSPSPPLLHVAEDKMLTWLTAQNNCGYAIYQKNSPYFTSSTGDPLASQLFANVSSYPSGNVVGQNRYYLVEGLGCGLNGGETAVSNEVGIFHFGITPGE